MKDGLGVDLVDLGALACCKLCLPRTEMFPSRRLDSDQYCSQDQLASLHAQQRALMT